MTVDDENSIYVGGIPYDFTESQLRRFFELYGSIIAVKIINDRVVGGKCYGFVTFTNPRSAVEAISEMNGKTIGGRVVRVNEVKSRSGGSRSMLGRESLRYNQHDTNGVGGRGRGRENVYDKERQRDDSRAPEGERERWRDRSRSRGFNKDKFQGRDQDQIKERHDWEHHHCRNRDREPDRDCDLDVATDTQIDRVVDHESDRERWRDRSRDLTRGRFQEGGRDRSRDMQDWEHPNNRNRDQQSDRDYDLDATKDTQMDRVVDHDRGGDKNKDHRTKRKHSSSYDGQTREDSSESRDHYHQEEQLDLLIKRRDELRNEKSGVEQGLEEKKQLIVDLQKSSKKLEDSLISAKKVTSMRQLQLTKLYKCFQQVKEYSEKVKSSEQELQELVDSVSMEIE